MAGIKAIIFDCFGVLVGQGYYAKYEYMGGDPVKDRKWLDSLLAASSRSEISTKELHKKVTSHLGITEAAYEEASRKMEVPNELLFSFIRNQLKPKYKIGLLSNANAGEIQLKIPPRKLALFDDVVVSGEVGFIKPEPEIYKLSLRNLAVKAAEAVFIDDQPLFVAGAKTVGLQTVLYESFEQFKTDLNGILNA